MKKNITILAILLICIIFSACTNSLGNTGAQTQTQTAAENAAVNKSANIEVKYDEDDLDTGDAAKAAKINLSGDTITFDGTGAKVDGSKITITSGGSYSISGTLNDGQIIVDTSDEETVKLILNGANITCSNSSAIYAANAKKTVVILAEGTNNVIKDGASYVFPEKDTDEPNAAIFSHDDLTINGSGSLKVDGSYQHGIVSKDDLKIVSGNIEVNSKADGIKGRNLVAIKEGTIAVNSGEDGIKSNNDEDADKGNILIESGTISINAGDDGIHAETALQIKNGTITIEKCYEGIESKAITIDGGNIDITSSDDGINAAGGKDGSGFMNGKPGQNQNQQQTQEQQTQQQPQQLTQPQQQQTNSSETYTLNINGGNITVNADGDGIDVNGAIAMTGGTVLVSGPTANNNGALDYDIGFNITGGTIIAAGSSGMAMAPDATSSQNSILFNLTETLAGGTMIHLASKSGEEIFTFVPEKQFQSVAVSSPSIKTGETYVLYSGGSSGGTEVNGLYTGGSYTKGTELASIETNGVVTTYGQTGMNPGGKMGKGGGNRPGGGMKPGTGPDGNFNPGNGQIPDGTNQGDSTGTTSGNMDSDVISSATPSN
jgi:hypothetical protein